MIDMTPKEKAKELVDKFTIVGLQQRNEGIQCALICVDEIIKRSDKNKIVYTFFESDCLTQYTEDFYWEKVKQEINKL
jgi:hypothetical protein